MTIAQDCLERLLDVLREDGRSRSSVPTVTASGDTPTVEKALILETILAIESEPWESPYRRLRRALRELAAGGHRVDWTRELIEELSAICSSRPTQP
jgi:hypothetical protein